MAINRKAYHKEHWANNKHKYANRGPHRDAEIKYQYGISLAEYEARLSLQNNICGMCKEPFVGRGARKLAPVLDHNHQTGTLRQFIHRSCNTAIGFLNDDPVKCRLAAEYLEKHFGDK